MTDALKGISKFAVEEGPYIPLLHIKQNAQVRVSLEYFLNNVFLVLTVVLEAARKATIFLARIMDDMILSIICIF